MPFTSVYKGIIFIEGSHASAKIGPPVEVDLSFVLGAQLKSLRDVKDNLALQANKMGFNTITDFTYGQKSRWLAIDNVAYWGKGNLANIPIEEYNELCSKQ